MMSNRVETLLGQMTLEEKVSLLAGADVWTTAPVDRLGIPAIKVTDGPNGVRGAYGYVGPRSACTPVGVALAATWNVELVEQVGRLLGEETRAKGAHILLGPTVNIHRSPLAGRNFECYSEDPYLAGCIATAYIRGVQSQGVGACIKHFVCNDSEYQRTKISSEVGERALHEIYLAPFRMAVGQARPWAVMSAYNKVNGTYASEHAGLLLDLLKEEWGFDGIVISDWDGTYSPNVLQGGLDLEMPGPARWLGRQVLEAVHCGAVGETVVDDKVRRLLRTIEKAGAFERPGLEPEQAVDRPEHRRLARRAAAEAVVLLKNEGTLLPLDPGKLSGIAVIGENARHAAIMGGGSSLVTPHYVVSPLEGIREQAGAVPVGYEVGCTARRAVPLLDPGWLTPEDGTGQGWSVDIFDNPDLAGAPVRRITVDRARMNWAQSLIGDLAPGAFSARLAARLSVPDSGRYQFRLASVGLSRLWVNAGPGGRRLLADNWSGRPDTGDPMGLAAQTGEIELAAGRPYRLDVEYSSRPAVDWLPLSIGCRLELADSAMDDAVALAARSSVAIVFAGLNDDWESEGYDRPDMELPGKQVALIERVAAANPNTIVVLNSGAPVTMDWLDRVPAVLQAWYGGQEAGNAIADVLFGRVNPAGRLPTTFPRRLADNPAYINYPGEGGQVHYGEGIFVGYRYYDRRQIEPLFPFGHGLSYTRFAYRNLVLDAGEYGPEDAIQVSVDVENVGACAGQEVVQLYVRDIECSVLRPEKELKAFAKVSLEPRETRTIRFTLEREALAFRHPEQRRWVSEPGEFEVCVGASSRNICLVGRLIVRGERDPTPGDRPRLHAGLTLRTVLADAAGKACLEKRFGASLDTPEVASVLDMTLAQIAEMMPDHVSPALLRDIDEELAAL